MNITSSCLILVIACLYSLLSDKAADYFLDKKGLDDKCSRLEYLSGSKMTESQKAQRKQCDKEYIQYGHDKMTALVVFGLLGLFLGFFLYKFTEGTDLVGSTGIGLGGLFVMMTFIVSNWHKMTDGYRLILITISLTATVYGAMLMQNGDINILG